MVGSITTKLIELHKIWSDVQEPVSSKSSFEVQLDAAVKDGKVDPRSGLGQRFSREHKDNADFKKLQGREAVASFRVEWAKRKLNEVRMENSHTRSYSQVDENVGEYLPFECIVEKYGFAFNREKAIQKATVYCEKCVKMGGKWMSYDEMSEDFEFLFVRRQSKELFAEKWAMFTKTFSEQQQYETEASKGQVTRIRI